MGTKGINEEGFMFIRSLIVSFISILLFYNLKAQETYRDGKKYVDYVHISFREQVVITVSGQKTASVEDIQPKYLTLRKYLNSIGPVVLKKRFLESRWGDTVKTNWRGKIVHVPEMSQYFILEFPEPVLEGAILDTLRKFPEVKSVIGPFQLVH